MILSSETLFLPEFHSEKLHAAQEKEHFYFHCRVHGRRDCALVFIASVDPGFIQIWHIREPVRG